MFLVCLFCVLGLFNKEISSAPRLSFVAIKGYKTGRISSCFMVSNRCAKNETVELLPWVNQDHVMLFFTWLKDGRKKASVGKFVGKSLSAYWKSAIEVPSSLRLAPREYEMSPSQGCQIKISSPSKISTKKKPKLVAKKKMSHWKRVTQCYSFLSLCM